MTNLLQVLELVKSLGMTGVTTTILAIAAVVVWLARQVVSMRKDLEQQRTDSATTLLKVWSEVEAKRPSSDDPKYEALREEVLRRFGVSVAAPGVTTIVSDRRQLPLRNRLLLCGGGAFAAQIVKVAVTILLRPADAPLSLILLGVVIGTIFFTVASVALVFFTLGKDGRPKTYILASFLAGLALPYLATALLSAAIQIWMPDA